MGQRIDKFRIVGSEGVVIIDSAWDSNIAVEIEHDIPESLPFDVYELLEYAVLEGYPCDSYRIGMDCEGYWGWADDYPCTEIYTFERIS